MISIEKKFLFIHLPKTGGNSIHTILSPYSGDRIVMLDKRQKDQNDFDFDVINEQFGLGKHATLKEYKKALEADIFNSLYKFATIRNPWDLCISYYFSPHRGDVKWDREKFKQSINIVPNLRDYIKTSSLIEKGRRRLLQKLSKTVGLDLNINLSKLDSEIDFIMRFENLNADFKKVADRLSIPFDEIPHKNKSKKKSYTTYYDDELINLVKYRFSEEIKFGNYKFGD